MATTDGTWKPVSVELGGQPLPEGVLQTMELMGVILNLALDRAIFARPERQHMHASHNPPKHTPNP
jgi:hypothetical protein